MTLNSLFTGLSDFDALAGPIPRGKVTVVAGRPSAGSTAFVLTVVRHLAAAGTAAAFVNLQCNHDRLTSNILAAESSTNTDRPTTLNEGRLARVKRASNAMEDVPLLTWTPTNRIQPGKFADELGKISDLGLVAVDTYALAAYHDETPGELFSTLQETAAKLNVAVLFTAHLNSADYGQHQSVPRFEELGLFQEPLTTADAVLLLHRPDTDDKAPSRRGEIDVIAERGWQTTGTVTVRFEPEYHRVVDLPNG